MRLILFNVYFDDYLHTFIINDINYTICVCECMENNETRCLFTMHCMRMVNNIVQIWNSNHASHCCFVQEFMIRPVIPVNTGSPGNYFIF